MSQRLVSTQPEEFQLFGWSVAVSGNRALIGQPGWIFQPEELGVAEIHDIQEEPPEEPSMNDATHVVTKINGSDFAGDGLLQVSPGQSLDVEITVENTGQRPWQRCSYKLGSWNPMDNRLWGTNRVLIDAGDLQLIHPGQQYTFRFHTQAPSTPGSYTFQWRMVDEAVEWFGEETAEIEVAVMEPGGWADYPGESPYEIPLPVGFRADPMIGGIAVADIGENQPGFIVTSPDGVAVFRWGDLQAPVSSDGEDELDLDTVNFLHADISDWEVTSKIQDVAIRDSQICIRHTKAGQWPVWNGVEGNPWVFVKRGGQWYGATYEWLRPGQICKGVTASNIGPHIKQPPLEDWVPQPGETVGFAVSTLARGSERTVNERSNVVLMKWPEPVLLWQKDLLIRLRSGASGGLNYPGTNHPGIFVSKGRLGFVNENNRLVIRDVQDGTLIASHPLRAGAQVALAANITGNNNEAIIQYDLNRIECMDITTGTVLWSTTQYEGFDHSPAFVADIDGDGHDEIVGVSSINSDGMALPRPDYPPGFNSTAVDSAGFGDVDEDGQIEMVLAEQGGLNRTWCVRPSDGTILWSNRARPATGIGDCAREIDPDKIVVGNFFPASPGLEVLARSACGREPWLIDSSGNLINHVPLDTILPDDWFRGPQTPDGHRSEGGIDVVSALDWHGNDFRNQLLLFKERHIEGDVGVINLVQERMGLHLSANAVFVMAADVSGDHREEIIVLERDRIKVFFHPNSKPLQARRWNDQLYERRKQNSNYYSLS